MNTDSRIEDAFAFQGGNATEMELKQFIRLTGITVTLEQFAKIKQFAKAHIFVGICDFIEKANSIVRLTHKEQAMQSAGIDAVTRYQKGEIELEKFWRIRVKIIGGKGRHIRFFNDQNGRTLSIYDMNREFTEAQLRNIIVEELTA